MSSTRRARAPKRSLLLNMADPLRPQRPAAPRPSDAPQEPPQVLEALLAQKQAEPLAHDRRERHRHRGAPKEPAGEVAAVLAAHEDHRPLRGERPAQPRELRVARTVEDQV